MPYLLKRVINVQRVTCVTNDVHNQVIILIRRELSKNETFWHDSDPWRIFRQAVAVAVAKATWNWVRGKCEEAMREVLGAGRGVQAGEVETPAMAAEAGRETRRGAESDEESDGCNEAQDSARVHVRVRNTQ